MTPAGDAHQNCCSKKCLHVFSRGEVEKNIFNVQEMSKEEKQHLLLAILSTSREDGQNSRRGKRIRASVKYSFKGVKVCRNAFMHIFNVNEHTIKSLSAHISENGVCTKKHGNAQRRPHNAAKYEDVVCVVNFVSNYADLYGSTTWQWRITTDIPFGVGDKGGAAQPVWDRTEGNGQS